MRKLKWGTDKFKGKLPIKYFECGKIGHIASKCPYAKSLENDEEEEEAPKNKNKIQKRYKGKLLKKKNIYLREDSSSSNEYDSDSDSRKVSFI